MPEVSVTSLPVRVHRQVDNARTALDRGNVEYSVNICRGILQEHPGCLPVRRLLRAAQLKLFKRRNPIVAKTLASIIGAPVVFYGQALLKRSPERAMNAAESVLGRDPMNVSALQLLARAALANDLPETAAFSLEAVCEAKPDDRTILIQLVDTYIAAGRTSDAVAIADRLLKAKPADLELQDVAKRASVAESISAGRWDSGSGSYRDKLRDEGLAISLEQSAKATNSSQMSERLVEESIARIEIEPGNLNHYRAVINGYRGLGKIDEALEWAGKARALPTGAVDSSIEKLEGDLRVASLDRRARERRAKLVAEGEDPNRDEALNQIYRDITELRISTLRALAEKYPSELRYKFDLAKLLQATGDVDGAIQQYQLAQRNPKLRVSAITALGECFRAKGLYDLAVQQFEVSKSELSVFDDEKKNVIYQLAASYEAMGQTEKALREYKEIYSADIGFRDVAEKIDGSYSRR